MGNREGIMQALQSPMVSHAATKGKTVHLPRLNAAGWCRWCDKRECSSPRCIRQHAKSVWMVCPECDGSEYSDWETGIRCQGCLGMSGLVEVLAPRSADVIDLSAVTR